MATNKETKKVIAKGIDKKEEPEVILGGKVIAIEVPDELAEVFEGLIGSLIVKCEDKDFPASENNQNNGDDPEDEVCESTEAKKLAADFACALGYRASDHLMMVKEKYDLPTDTMLAITKGLHKAHPDGLIIMLKAIFISSGMNDVANELKLLDICKEHEEDAAFFFDDAFWNTDDMDWYSVENLLRDKAKEQNKKLN